MPDFEYTSTKELDEFVKNMPDQALDAAELGMAQALIYLHRKIPDYPAATLERLTPPDGVSFLRTDAQRKWFFKAVRSGQLNGWEWVKDEIDGHNISHVQKTGSARTATLGRRFTELVKRKGQAVEGTLGTNLGYAPWAVGPDFPGEEINGQQMYQARVHVDRWWQFGDVIDENIEAAWRVFEKKFWEIFQQLVEVKKYENKI